MTRRLCPLRRFRRDAAGATAVEYGLIVAGLSIVVVTAVIATGTSLYAVMNNVSNTIARAH